MTSSSPNDRSVARRAVRMAPHEWRDLGIAAWELGRARLILGRATALDLLGESPPTAPPPGKVRTADQAIARVRTAIARVGHRLPWRADCVVQALAARHWLDRLGLRSSIEVGVRERGTAPFEAHAWLVCDGIVVTGGDISDYSPLRPGSR